MPAFEHEGFSEHAFSAAAFAIGGVVVLPDAEGAWNMTGPTSSAALLADLALAWETTSGDLVMVDSDLASDRGIETAVILSLFTDRRALVDDVPPSGDSADRRGWWADQFLAVEGDRIGSRLWLLDRSKRTDEVRRRAEEYSSEALAWMIEDHVAERVDVTTELTTDDLLIAVTVHRPGREPISLRFAHVWTAIEEGP